MHHSGENYQILGEHKAKHAKNIVFIISIIELVLGSIFTIITIKSGYGAINLVLFLTGIFGIVLNFRKNPSYTIIYEILSVISAVIYYGIGAYAILLAVSLSLIDCFDSICEDAQDILVLYSVAIVIMAFIVGIVSTIGIWKAEVYRRILADS